jgi:Holliday junction resolvase RusA-like endonuclease
MTPTSWSKKKRESMTGEGMTSRPDIDNLYKSVTDAMNGIVYCDDSQITRALMRKQYNENDSGVLISVGRKDEFPLSWR